MKVHYFDLTEHLKVPMHLREGYKMSKCGYLRKETTIDFDEVTCKLCIKEMKKIGLIK